MYTSSSLQSTHASDWITSVVLLPVCVYYLYKGAETTILDTLCMLVFDAGRLVAGGVSAPLAHVGGAALLVALPLGLIWYFGVRGYRFGLQVFLFWLGQNLIFLGRMTMDIEARHVSLLSSYQFDLYSILSYLQLADVALLAGQVLFMLGTVTFIIMLILPLYVSR